MFIFQQWKWPTQGTGTVPVLSAHFRSVWALDDVVTDCVTKERLRGGAWVVGVA